MKLSRSIRLIRSLLAVSVAVFFSMTVLICVWATKGPGEEPGEPSSSNQASSEETPPESQQSQTATESSESEGSQSAQSSSETTQSASSKTGTSSRSTTSTGSSSRSTQSVKNQSAAGITSGEKGTVGGTDDPTDEGDDKPSGGGFSGSSLTALQRTLANIIYVPIILMLGSIYFLIVVNYSAMRKKRLKPKRR